MNYHSYQMSSRYQIVYVVPDNPSGDPSVGLLNPSHSLQLFRARRLPD